MVKSKDTAKNGSRSVGTVGRAISMYAAVVDAGRPVGIQELGEMTGLPPSTTHRLLALLADEGMIERDPRAHSYRVGPEGYRLAARTLETVGLPRVVRPVLDRLAERFDETVLFGQYAPPTSSFAFLARSDGNHSLQYVIELNRPSSLLWGASGRAVTAFLDEDDVQAVLAVEASDTSGRLTGVAGIAVPDEDELRRDLAEIRERGYAVSEGQKLPRARGIAVPVRGADRIVGSVTLTHPDDRTPHGDLETIVEELTLAAEEISRYVGGTGASR